jgi:hypothetical protein
MALKQTNQIFEITYIQIHRAKIFKKFKLIIYSYAYNCFYDVT